MNNIIKSLIGLATAGTVITGAFFAFKPAPKEKTTEEINIDWGKRWAPKIEKLESIFVELKNNEDISNKLAQAIDVNNDPRAGKTVFLINPETNQFYGRGDVSTALSVWCKNPTGAPKLDGHPNLENEVCVKD